MCGHGYAETWPCYEVGVPHVPAPMSVPLWSLLLGLLLLTMVLVGTLVARLPLSSAMIYLAIGWAAGWAAPLSIAPDPLRNAYALELAAEVAVLISLFAVGLRLGVPVTDARWRLPLQLAFVSMAGTVGLIAAVGVLGLDLSLGAAVLLGAILAPTDPVLASGVQAHGGREPDLVRFGLAGEGGLNDGTAFPFVMLGLGLLGLHDLGTGGWRWWAIDLVWATVAGLVVGGLAGALIAQLIVRVRTRFDAVWGHDEFLSLGVIAIAYGSARLCMGSGFLAVFAAGLAFRHWRQHAADATAGPQPGRHETGAAHARQAGTMTLGVKSFNEQLERIGELAIVLLVGAMLPYASLSARLAGFIALLFVVLRPLAVWLGTLGCALDVPQRAVISWFGIRGIGSVFYLMFALERGVGGALAQFLVDATLMTVSASIILHGISAHSLMSRYGRRSAPGGDGSR